MFNPSVLVSSLHERITLDTSTFQTSRENVYSVSECVERVDDAELCRRLRVGEVSALRQLMARHGPAVRKLAMNVLSDEAEAEDVAQEVFLTVWKHRANWSEGGAKFSTWLHRVTLNKAIDKRRMRRCRPETPETMTQLCDAAPPASASGEQELAVCARENANLLHAAMRNLPANQARALVLFYLEERDAEATADAMGLSEQAVRSLLKRGKQALRERLENPGVDHDPSRPAALARQPRACRG